MQVFGLFDSDGSGSIDFDKLKRMMLRVRRGERSGCARGDRRGRASKGEERKREERRGEERR